jgi:hypothetical protein
MSGDQEFDLEKLQITSDDMIPVKRVRPKLKRDGHFIRVPWPWVERLAAIQNGACWAVALRILYDNWRHKGKPFTLSNGAVPGVSRYGKYRALRELEKLGLIIVQRRPRKSPVISQVLIDSLPTWGLEKHLDAIREAKSDKAARAAVRRQRKRHVH